MADKPMYEAFTSPVGEAIYPWITRADTTYDADGIYHCDLSVPFELAQDFIAKLEGVRNAFINTLPVAKQKSLAPKDVYREELTRPERPEGSTDEEWQAIKDAWEGEPTGNVLFRCKLKARVTPKSGDGWTQKPAVVTADTGEAVEEPVYGGSIVRIRGQIVPYTNDAAQSVGVTLRMRAVQVIELVTGSADGGGFWIDFDNEAA
jgi:hypothetical protein